MNDHRSEANPSDKQLANLREYATEFRKAILKCDPNKLPVTMQRFPYGSCGDAALLLAKYLWEKGCGQFTYMLGMRDGHSHAWLQRGKLIIDITADQFPDLQPPVIVTSENSWHTAFAGVAENIADYKIYDRHTAIMLDNAYQKIKEQIQA